MDPRLIHPEDRRRDGGSDVGRGCGDEDGDTVPPCYRSEAFAEDLSQGEGQLPPPPARQRRTITPAVTRPGPARKPLLGLGWVAALGLRGALRD
jgi:hypothetical protein